VENPLTQHRRPGQLSRRMGCDRWPRGGLCYEDGRAALWLAFLSARLQCDVKRRELAGIIDKLKRQLDQHRADLTHIDRVLRVLAADLDPEKIRPNRVLKNSRVIPGRPIRAGPGTHEHRPAIDFSGPCSWVPGSRAKPAPQNDDVPAIFRNLLSCSLSRLRASLFVPQ
jgi:hypothetical protein